MKQLLKTTWCMLTGRHQLEYDIRIFVHTTIFTYTCPNCGRTVERWKAMK